MSTANVIPLVALQHYAVDNNILSWDDTLVHLRVLSPGKNKGVVDWSRSDFEVEDYRLSLECRMTCLGFMDEHKFDTITVLEGGGDLG